MPKNVLPRRSFLKEAGVLAAPLLMTLPTSAGVAGAAERATRLKIVCVGGHPDDPESGCGGTLTRYAEAGHSVTVVYLTRGERGIRNSSLNESAKIRTAECEKACRIMGVQPRFFGQIDGATEMTREQVQKMTAVLEEEKPDLLFTHWPVDTHMDHQVASLLTIRAWMALGERAQLHFFEVDTGDQTQGFLPNVFVDITSVLEKKKAALFEHVSQNGKQIWSEHHEIIAKWRGREAGVPAAEGFLHLSRDVKNSRLPAI